MTADSRDLTLELQRILPAARWIAFGAFSARGGLADWWGPRGFSVADLDFDPRVGRSYRIEMRPPEGDPFTLTGRFREIDPPARLAYTFVWEEPDPDDVETLVELSFRESGDATEVALTQGPFTTEARRELHRDGWTDAFDRLDEYLSRP